MQLLLARNSYILCQLLTPLTHLYYYFWLLFIQPTFHELLQVMLVPHCIKALRSVLSSEDIVVLHWAGTLKRVSLK